MSSNDPKGLATESELQEIMQEIEQMEAESGPAPEVSEMNEFRGSSDDASLEDTVGELKEDPAAAQGNSILDASEEEQVEEHVAESTDHADGVHETADPTMNVAPVATGGAPIRAVHGGSGSSSGAGSHSGSGAPGSLTMTLSGSMTLRLRYEFEGQDVTVGFDEGCFRVELADGTEFKVPVRKAAALKRVV